MGDVGFGSFDRADNTQCEPVVYSSASGAER